MSNLEFEQDILNVLKKYGFKTDVVTGIDISIKEGELPLINIEYIYI